MVLGGFGLHRAWFWVVLGCAGHGFCMALGCTGHCFWMVLGCTGHGFGWFWVAQGIVFGWFWVAKGMISGVLGVHFVYIMYMSISNLYPSNRIFLELIVFCI